VVGDSDACGFVILVQHLHSTDGGHQGRDPLLAVDEDALTLGVGAILQLDVRVLPGDQITDWKPAQQ